MFTPRIAIVGAGFAGLCVARQLLRAGFDDLRIFEQADHAGGTWLANTYPGAECDVPSALYSYSFAANPDWSRRWSGQAEILDYLQRCVAQFGLTKLLTLGCAIQSARFDDAACVWHVELGDGRQLEFDVVISATGQLARPFVPPLAGRDLFRGAAFHSARWRHDVDLRERHVAVIGNAASAVQLVPRLAEQVASLTVFQRSANWVLPKNNRAYRPLERALLRSVPGLARAHRLRIWLTAECLFFPFTGTNPLLRRLGTARALRHIDASIADPKLRAALTPDYPLGAKRILFSDDYYPALTRPHVRLETAAIDALTAHGVRTATGREIAADAVVFATGFATGDFLAPIDVRGRDGLRLEEHWRDGAHAWLGIATAGFPNLFMLYGPNTNLGHNSIVLMLECQSRYIVSCLAQMRTRGVRSVSVRPQVEARFVAEMQRRLARKAWAEIDHSWYLHGGRNTNNWPGRTSEYWRRTRRCDLADFDCRPGGPA